MTCSMLGKRIDRDMATVVSPLAAALHARVVLKRVFGFPLASRTLSASLRSKREHWLVLQCMTRQRSRGAFNTVKPELAIEHFSSLWMKPTHRMARPSFRHNHRIYRVPPYKPTQGSQSTLRTDRPLHCEVATSPADRRRGGKV